MADRVRRENPCSAQTLLPPSTSEPWGKISKVASRLSHLNTGSKYCPHHRGAAARRCLEQVRCTRPQCLLLSSGEPSEAAESLMTPSAWHSPLVCAHHPGSQTPGTSRIGPWSSRSADDGAPTPSTSTGRWEVGRLDTPSSLGLEPLCQEGK